MDYADKTQRCQYVEALEEEKRKIQVFQRELPLCLELVTQTIEACKRELSDTTMEHTQGHLECSEQTSSDAPVLEEFMPIKRGSYREAEVDQEDHDRSSNKRTKNVMSGSTSDNNKENDYKRKSDWLRSVQLWNQPLDPSPHSHREEVPRMAVVTEVKRSVGAFQPFQRDMGITWSSDGRTYANGDGAESSDNPAAIPASATSSSAETVGSGGGTSRKEEKDASGQRKQRRRWSPELHRRF